MKPLIPSRSLDMRGPRNQNLQQEIGLPVRGKGMQIRAKVFALTVMRPVRPATAQAKPTPITDPRQKCRLLEPSTDPGMMHHAPRVTMSCRWSKQLGYTNRPGIDIALPSPSTMKPPA